MDSFALILAIVGAINAGSIGLFGVDLIGSIFGGTHAVVTRIIFSVIGLAGLWAITLLFREQENVPLRDKF